MWTFGDPLVQGHFHTVIYTIPRQIARQPSQRLNISVALTPRLDDICFRRAVLGLGLLSTGDDVTVSGFAPVEFGHVTIKT